MSYENSYRFQDNTNNQNVITNEKFNPITELNDKVKNAADELNEPALIILAYHIFYCRVERYYVSTALYNRITQLLVSVKPYTMPPLPDKHNLYNDIEYIYFLPYKKQLDLQEHGYNGDVPTIKQHGMLPLGVNKYYNDGTYITNLFSSSSIVVSSYNKYIKYKEKYIKLKNKIKLM